MSFSVSFGMNQQERFAVVKRAAQEKAATGELSNNTDRSLREVGMELAIREIQSGRTYPKDTGDYYPGIEFDSAISNGMFKVNNALEQLVKFIRKDNPSENAEKYALDMMA